jgi:hypothetical protein
MVLVAWVAFWAIDEPEMQNNANIIAATLFNLIGFSSSNLVSYLQSCDGVYVRAAVSMQKGLNTHSNESAYSERESAFSARPGSLCKWTRRAYNCA